VQPGAGWTCVNGGWLPPGLNNPVIGETEEFPPTMEPESPDVLSIGALESPQDNTLLSNSAI
jgi:hypothetical protein